MAKENSASCIKPGLVSVTFRKLSPAEIVELVRKAGLQGIEWGGDVHVPHGDMSKAGEVKELTTQAGLAVSSYGSYYRAGESEAEGLPFEKVLDTGIELGAPLIRVWAGRRGSASADEEYWRTVGEDLHRIGEAASAAGIRIACESHRNTLTDDSRGALRLMRETGHDNVGLYWQIPFCPDLEGRKESLAAITAYLANLHVFQWLFEGGKRGGQLPLSDGESDWAQYLDIVRGTGRSHWALIEFVKDGDPDQFLSDAAALRQWVS